MISASVTDKSKILPSPDSYKELFDQNCEKSIFT
jgi:hypothetical protein